MFEGYCTVDSVVVGQVIDLFIYILTNFILSLNQFSAPPLSQVLKAKSGCRTGHCRHVLEWHVCLLNPIKLFLGFFHMLLVYWTELCFNNSNIVLKRGYSPYFVCRSSKKRILFLLAAVHSV